MAENNPNPPPSDQNQTAEWFRFAGIGFEFISTVAVTTAVGYGLDRWLDSSPWFMLVGVGSGFALGLILLVRSARKMFHD